MLAEIIGFFKIVVQLQQLRKAAGFGQFQNANNQAPRDGFSAQLIAQKRPHRLIIDTQGLELAVCYSLGISIQDRAVSFADNNKILVHFLEQLGIFFE